MVCWWVLKIITSKQAGKIAVNAESKPNKGKQFEHDVILLEISGTKWGNILKINSISLKQTGRTKLSGPYTEA